MTQRDRKRLLLAINALLVVAVVASVASALWPLDDQEPIEPIAKPRRPAAANEEQKVGPLSDYSVIYDRNLRQSLSGEETTAKPTTPTLPIAPMPPLQLLGTAAEDGSGYAVLQTATGETKVLGVGEEHEGIKLVSVQPESVVLDYNGRRVTLEVQKPADTSSLPGMPYRPPSPVRSVRTPVRPSPVPSPRQPRFRPPPTVSREVRDDAVEEEVDEPMDEEPLEAQE